MSLPAARPQRSSELPPPGLPPGPAQGPHQEAPATQGRRVWLTSFGCQMNVLDAELVAGDLARRGWAKAETMDEADVVLLQTCSVREHAEDKVWSLLGRARLLKQERPGMLIGVLGCMAQRAKEQIVRRAPHVDLVLGTSSFRTAVDDLEDLALRGGRVLRTERTPPPERLPDADRDVTQRPDPFRAYVTVMRGCDHVCAYCIVPFTRGREVSRPLAEVLEEVRRLADDGVREVTFLGQNINTYGKDLGEGGLATLLERSAAVPGIERLRFLTSNPFDMTEDMMRRMGAVPQVMPWLHIPAQSGHDAVLQRMKRTYTVAQYEEVVAWARRHVPGVEITSDFIVGFPGESEEQFQASVALVQRVGFLQAYVFKYSVRPRTLAARRLPDDVPEEVKKRRNQELLDAQDRSAALRQATLLGAEVEILVEGPSKTDPTRVTGRDRYNRLVHAAGDGARLAGRLVRVQVTESSAHCLIGRVLDGDGR